MGQLNVFPAADSFLLQRQKLRALLGGEGAWAVSSFSQACIVLLSAPESPEFSPSLFLPLMTDRKFTRTWGCLCIHGSYTCSEELPISIFREEGIASTGLSASLGVLCHPREAVCQTRCHRPLSSLKLPVKRQRGEASRSRSQKDVKSRREQVRISETALCTRMSETCCH